MFGRWLNRSRSLRWEIYKDKGGEYRWRAIAVNGNVVGASSEGYERLVSCVENARLFGCRSYTTV